MRALVSARRGIEKNPAHAHFHSMDGGAGDELPSFNEQGFDVLVDGDAQTRWLVEQLAIMDGANTPGVRSEEHTSELQSLMRISYAVFCLKKKNHLITRITEKLKTLYKTNTT